MLRHKDDDDESVVRGARTEPMFGGRPESSLGAGGAAFVRELAVELRDRPEAFVGGFEAETTNQVESFIGGFFAVSVCTKGIYGTRKKTRLQTPLKQAHPS